MKHASRETLDRLTDLLTAIRQYSPPLKEKKLGVFYLKSTAFLHFHDDPAGIFVDLKVEDDWVRYPVNNQQEWTDLITSIHQQVNSNSTVHVR